MKIILLTLLMAVSAHADQTATGIPIDSQWKKETYAYAVAHSKHTAWGLSHSERNYLLTLEIAKEENIAIDTDVLFAASFLHDLGALNEFKVEGVDHAVRSIEIAKPLLQKWGFPMRKFPEVEGMIHTHMFDAGQPASKQALAFREADTLDFLGALGAARIISVTLESGSHFYSPQLASPFTVLSTFRSSLPGLLTLRASKALSVPRVDALDAFMKAAKADARDGKAY